MYTDPEVAAIQNVRSELLEKLHDAPAGSIAPLDLNGVQLSASCIAAVLGPVLIALAYGHLARKFVIVLDPTGRNAWDADAGLRKESDRVGHKLVCVWQGKRRLPDLVGPVDEQVKATYGFVLETWIKAHDGATARDLAESAGVSIQAASNRLSKAASLGLLFASDREAVSGGGAQYVFVPVV